VIGEGILVPETRGRTQGAIKALPALNAEQSAAVEQITAALDSANRESFLLFGVTGSGKTEVYLRGVAAALALGRRALVLVPEIALTAQILGQLRERFGPSVAVMHSGLPAGERLRNWRAAADGSAPVVVGARSAIFAPLQNIGLIVIDEEHDSSYKQDNAPRYDVRALAEWRALHSDASLVVGSATPSVETYHRATLGEFRLLKLSKRAATTSLPEVFIEDLRESYKLGKPSILSQRLRSELESTIGRGEQAMLFINRRAFARSLVCRDCGYGPKCPRCSVSFTFHMRPPHLRCHHCDSKEPVPESCPKCGSLRLRPLGLGTQKVEQFLRSEMPSVGVGRLDRDVASRRGAVEETFGRVRSGQIQALVGTQMIAKGLDFENVTLVGVISADMGLSIPDYRSTERTFQLLTQVAGRAGRRKPGRVVVQTFSPDYPAIRYASTQDYEAFYAYEIEERRGARYPPFVRLVNVVVAGPDRDAVRDLAEAARSTVESEVEEATVYGPAECALARLREKWRAHVLVKLPPDFEMKRFPRAKDFQVLRPFMVTVDVDPASLL
jgi:primosomal protein N' (replication factor Y)